MRHFLEKYVTSGDIDQATLYQAVGRFITSWEYLEVALAFLYGDFVRQPNISAYRQYGNGRIFRERLDTLCRAASNHFIAYPNQTLEGDFDKLVSKVSELSVQRNEIAHGVVQRMPDAYIQYAGVPKELGHPFWLLMPPLYATKNHDPNSIPSYAYNSGFVRVLAKCCARRISNINLLRSSIKRNSKQAPRY